MESKTISELSEEGRCYEYNNEKERQIIRLEEKLKKCYQQMEDYEADIQDMEMQLRMMEFFCKKSGQKQKELGKENQRLIRSLLSIYGREIGPLAPLLIKNQNQDYGNYYELAQIFHGKKFQRRSGTKGTAKRERRMRDSEYLIGCYGIEDDEYGY